MQLFNCFLKIDKEILPRREYIRAHYDHIYCIIQYTQAVNTVIYHDVMSLHFRLFLRQLFALHLQAASNYTG